MLEFDLAIECAHLLSMKDGRAITVPKQLLGIIGEKISYIGPLGNPYKASKTIFATNHVVMPGLINGHTHMPMTLFRGLGDDQELETWLTQVIFPLEARDVSPEFVTRGSELALQECIRAGVTTFCDMYYFMESLAEVTDRMGLRAIVAESFCDFPTPDNKQLNDNYLRITDRLIEKYKNHPRIIPAIGPHAPYTCSDETLIKARDYAIKNNIPLSIHVAETAFEVRESIKKYGMTPVERLHKLGLTQTRCIFAHCVHLSENDRKILKQNKVGIIHNPESNMKLGSGIAPIKMLLEEDQYVGLGTDGAASNNNLNMFQEMDTAAKLQKLALSNSSAMTAEMALDMATRRGAMALGLSDKIGTLEAGKLADIITVSLESPNMQPLHNVASQLVYATNGSEVEHVICHGRLLLGS